jgi:hypothetical protein
MGDHVMGPTHLYPQYSTWAFSCIEVVLFPFLQIAIPDLQAFTVYNFLNSFLEDSLGFKPQPLDGTRGFL